jgi:RNA polymerase sigma factor (sigma-70 family)
MEPDRLLGSQESVNEATRPAHVANPAASDSERFGDFYHREYEGAVRLAWLLTGSRAAAEDVVQDAMVALYRSFEPVESPGAYLRRAVINGAKSRQRNERHQRERVTLLEHERPVFDDADVDAELFDRIHGLPYRQRVVIVARYWGGWSETDIARALGCRPGTVKSLASRALNRLRKEVEQ